MEPSEAGPEVEEIQNDDDPAQSLCSECKAIFDNWYDRDNWSSARPGHTHHNIVELQLSARKGCPVCALLLRDLDHDAIEELLQKWPDFKGSVTVKQYIKSNPVRYVIEVLFYEKGSEKPSIQLEDFGKAAIEAFPSASTSTKIGKVQDMTDCEENWELVKKWLRVCRETHANCSQTFFDRELPTRLIDVGVNDQDLKLCETGSLPRHTQYLTLSHCWGEKVFTTLTSSNFQRFLSHIPTVALTKTFREAIVTTRKLGFKYLWIDSLCIIQGDEVDWLHEASRMGTVYANSALNLAAAAASSGDFGCFPANTTGQVSGCKVATRIERDSPRTSVWDCVVFDFTFELLYNNVLNSRAWVFQELFMTARTLHFTAQQLFWECISSTACEVFPDAYNDTTIIRPAIKISLMAADPNPEYDMVGEWSGIVMDYSRGDVTFSKDRIVAISGIARLFAARFGTTYLAGMWKEDLVKQLCWSSEKASEINTRSSMPSWSWASINTSVSFPESLGMERNSIPLVSILEATTVVCSDIFGDVKGGKIRMRCRLPCTVTVMQQYGRGLLALSSQNRQLFFRLYPDTVPYSVGDEIYLLAFLRGDLPLIAKELLCGLVLEPVEPASYRRTGYFDVLGGSIQDFMAVQDEATSQNKYFNGEALGPDKDGHEMCIITLI